MWLNTKMHQRWSQHTLTNGLMETMLRPTGPGLAWTGSGCRASAFKSSFQRLSCNQGCGLEPLQDTKAWQIFYACCVLPTQLCSSTVQSETSSPPMTFPVSTLHRPFSCLTLYFKPWPSYLHPGRSDPTRQAASTPLDIMNVATR